MKRGWASGTARAQRVNLRLTVRVRLPRSTALIRSVWRPEDSAAAFTLTVNVRRVVRRIVRPSSVTRTAFSRVPLDTRARTRTVTRRFRRCAAVPVAQPRFTG